MNTEDDLIPTRNSLLTRLKDWEDQEGWRRFFDTYWKLIYGTAMKSGLSHAEAEDVVQETVIAVARKMESFKYDPALGSFKGWLLNLTRWRIGDQFRKRGAEWKASAPSSDETSRTSTVERIPDEASLKLDAIWEEEWQKNLWDAAIARVKLKVGARQYQMFDLYVLKDWPVADVVSTLGVTEFQVYKAKSRIARVIKREVKYLEAKML
jgi:RNA polymerase sigma factor (sigma-70 family)